MAIYVLLSNLTDEGRKTLKERPERLKEVNQEIERMGARVLTQYAVLGSYDFVNIVEAPTNEVIARISVELGSRGTVQLTTLPAMNIDAFVQMIRESGSH
ncbi:MAG: GYD domain-containing protein [Deltaproteobacteria bacterium]|nr:GYD domain-containing protein [Deltaproteobacteria bacterium]